MVCRHPFWMTPGIGFAPGPVEAVEGTAREIEIELRSVVGERLVPFGLKGSG
jgi:hypothetical protein